ncbi:hypothetical protein Tco_0367514 [Tanacetum coccineum]
MYHDNIQEYVSQAAAANFNQANSGYRPSMVSNQIRPPGFPPVQNPHANNQNNFNEEIIQSNRGETISNQGQIIDLANDASVGETWQIKLSFYFLVLELVLVYILPTLRKSYKRTTMPPADKEGTEDVHTSCCSNQTRNPILSQCCFTPVNTPVLKHPIPFPSRRMM